MSEWKDVADRIIAENPDKFVQATFDPPRWAGWFVGKVQREVGGRAPMLPLRDYIIWKMNDYVVTGAYPPPT